MFTVSNYFLSAIKMFKFDLHAYMCGLHVNYVREWSNTVLYQSVHM